MQTPQGCVKLEESETGGDTDRGFARERYRAGKLCDVRILLHVKLYRSKFCCVCD